MEENNNVVTTPVVEPQKKKGNVGLIVFLVILVLGLAGYICYDKFFSKEDSAKVEDKEKQEIKDDNKEELIDNNQKDGIKGDLTISDLDGIMPTTIDESLSHAKLNGYISEGTIIDKYGDTDLLNDSKFKFAFAFFLGMKYDDLYVEEEESSCGYYITMENYKIVYKNIYGEEYSSNTIPEGTNFRMTDKGIWGCIITGYGEPIHFEKVNSNSGNYLVAIKVLDDNKLPSEEYNTLGHMKIVYNNQSDGKLAIKGVWFTK